MRGNNKLPSVHYGRATEQPKKFGAKSKRDTPDDDKLRKTLTSVKRILGFDPAQRNKGQRK